MLPLLASFVRLRNFAFHPSSHVHSIWSSAPPSPLRLKSWFQIMSRFHTPSSVPWFSLGSNQLIKKGTLMIDPHSSQSSQKTCTKKLDLKTGLGVGAGVGVCFGCLAHCTDSPSAPLSVLRLPVAHQGVALLGLHAHVRVRQALHRGERDAHGDSEGEDHLLLLPLGSGNGGRRK